MVHLDMIFINFFSKRSQVYLKGNFPKILKAE